MEGGDGTYSIYQWWSRGTHQSNTWRGKGARKLGEEVVYITGELFADRVAQVGVRVRTFDNQKFFQAFLSGESNHFVETSLRSDSEGSFFFNHFFFLKKILIFF
jgi:hypothetical protein